jgi:hypothetical protein
MKIQLRKIAELAPINNHSLSEGVWEPIIDLSMPFHNGVFYINAGPNDYLYIH